MDQPHAGTIHTGPVIEIMSDARGGPDKNNARVVSVKCGLPSYQGNE